MELRTRNVNLKMDLKNKILKIICRLILKRNCKINELEIVFLDYQLGFYQGPGVKPHYTRVYQGPFVKPH